MVFGSFNLNSETLDLKWTFQGRNVTYTAGDNLKPNAIVASSWGQTFNNDGTKFFLVQNGVNSSNTFTLSRPYDLTSVTSATPFTAATSGGSSWNALSFSPDFRYYAGGSAGSVLRIYTCATRGVIGASDTVLTSLLVGNAPQSMGVLHGLSWTGQNYIFAIDVNFLIVRFIFSPSAGTITYDGQRVDVSTATLSRSIYMNQSGTKLFTLNNEVNKSIYEFSLQIPYDLTSFIIHPTIINTATLVTDEPATMNVTDVTMNPDMTRIYVGDFSSSIANSRVYQLRIK